MKAGVLAKAAFFIWKSQPVFIFSLYKKEKKMELYFKYQLSVETGESIQLLRHKCILTYKLIKLY